MQMHFSGDEFRMLADILAQRHRELREEISRTDTLDFRRRLRDQQRALDELQSKVLRQDIEFCPGDLDLFREVIERRERELTAEIAHTDRHDFRAKLRYRAELLAQVREKLTAAGATV